MRKAASMVVLVATALAAGAGLWAYVTTDRSHDEAVAEMMRLRLPDVSGESRSLEQWRDGVLIVNFWATWCGPCRQEIPLLVRFQTKYASKGVQIVGISVDSADKVRQFALEYRVGYPLLIGSFAVLDLSRRLGNTASALPYTVVFDRNGKVIRTRLGAITEIELEKAIQMASS
ncbi:MAG: hypothetical protein A3H32_05320 [Betaproteobacteria bacterium RIFCSPLOWO2_02_FULL_63_19]|nr:MAG: hypothetical protein A3H32_05320 [Betaproteobacteria bacterium RIFCSPLOWO2_02_FULL_63_19]